MDWRVTHKMKILHYMPVPSKIYNKIFIDMIQNDSRFNEDEHIFWILTEESYQISKNEKNVYLKKKHLISELKKINNYVDVIIIHGFEFKFYELLCLNSDIRKKMAWVVWGHDLYRMKDITQRTPKEMLKYFIKKILYKHLQVPFVKKIKCIGIGFPYDAVEIKKWYGDKVIKSAPYGMGYNFESIKKIKKDIQKNIKKKQTINILLGHSAYEYLRHIENLKRLQNYQGKNIKIFIPLSYGNSAYMDQIKKHIEKVSMNIELLTELLTEEQYLEFLSNIDIAIFDFKHQAALGNIYLLLYFEKKIYLDIEGVLYKGFKNQNVSVFDTNTIGQVPYEDFTNLNFSTSNGISVSENIFDLQKVVEDWKELFLYCTEEREYI